MQRPFLRATSSTTPLGGLSYELNKHDAGPGADAARPLRTILDWAERQFRELEQRNPRAPPP